MTMIVLGFVISCGKADDPARYANSQLASRAATKTPSTIVKVQTPVAPGAKVHCADWIDLSVFQTALGEKRPVALKDRSRAEIDPSAICSIIKGGKPSPATPRQKLRSKRGPTRPAEQEEVSAQILGVIAGDELCLVYLHCGYSTAAEDLRAKCATDPMSEWKPLDGLPACVRRTQRAENWAHKYTLIDPSTQCGVEVRGGPSVTSEAHVRACARASIASLSPAGIANPYAP